MQSPEKLQATLEEMGAAVELERAAAADAEKRLRAAGTRSEHVTKVRAQGTGHRTVNLLCCRHSL